MRPVILGMNNPLSLKPEHALFPYPPGCTGHRILEMLRTRVPDVSRSQYLGAFDRRNLLTAREWCAGDAKLAAVAFLQTMRDTGRVVLVLGEGPRHALGIPKLLVHPQEYWGVTWRQLPHPSGRCRWYNDPACRGVAALLLEELYKMGDSHARNKSR